MHPWICVNGELAVEAELPALSAAALYGRGVFTTVSIVGGEPFLWEKHWRRLTENAAAIGIDPAEFAETDVNGWLDGVIGKNRVTDGVARITLFDIGPTAMWSHGAERAALVLIATRGRRPVSSRFRLTLSPYRVNSASPLAGIKTCNYLENIIAGEEAHERGFDEAIRVNERGEVAGGTMSNVFWLNDGKLYTPPLSSGCLAGTTREYVLERLTCDEAVAGPEELRNADAIFMTSAGLGVAQAFEFEGRGFAASDHAILNLISRFKGTKKHETT